VITTSKLTVGFGGTPLFEDVNVKFVPGNCYGLIGANGAGKSTFLKVLSGDLEPSAGEVIMPGNLRLAKLEQDQFKFDEMVVLDAVMFGHPSLYEVHKKREAIYAKTDFDEADGARAAEIEMAFADMNGYEAESEVSILLTGLGVDQELHQKPMGELESGDKVRVLLAQALFGQPDILLLDEPTNHLDVHTVAWLEDYISRLKTLVIVVSHDRHFLNNVCTHIADIDFRSVKVYAGNYDFWVQASELALQQRRDERKKATDKAKDLKTFIERFSSNASKAKQATSRKKLLEKLTLDDLPTSTRKYPHIVFKPDRAPGRLILSVEDVSKTIDGEKLLDNVSFTLQPGDRVAFVGQDARPKSALFDILAGVTEPDSGTVEWGSTMSTAYFPRENEAFFEDTDINLIDWLRQYTANKHEEDVRSFLGRMLFTGEDSLKPVGVLSGGEKVRCMLSRMMQTGANALILDEPTNHLDLESITSLNNALRDTQDTVILLSSLDRELLDTVANRVIEITRDGIIDHRMNFEDYLASEHVGDQRHEESAQQVAL
jgi:ATPase subunit of ABC transporter with duplicated ATPase domains